MNISRVLTWERDDGYTVAYTGSSLENVEGVEPLAIIRTALLADIEVKVAWELMINAAHFSTVGKGSHVN